MVPERVKLLLHEIGPLLSHEGFYLAGGTALALLIGHRESVDVDFFRPGEIDVDLLERDLAPKQVLLAKRDTLTFRRGGVKVECLRYDYPLLFPPSISEGVTVAHPVDIGLMKISAISSRGAKRDFIDLFEIAHHFMALGDLFGLLPQKYGLKANRLHMLKSLVYFDDAERDPDPGGWDSTQWPTIKQFFMQSASQIRLLEHE